MSTTVFAPAKINLWLRIFKPDATGYHPIDTLFCALDLADRIVINTDHDGLRLDVVGPAVGPAEKNLAYRAAREFFDAVGCAPRAAIHLAKNIPAGAGLGGGSSDAAAVLRALNTLHGDALPTADLMAIGARIGSDVPFFLCGSHFAHGTGRGEILRGDPALPMAAAIIVAPKLEIATVDAYRWLDEQGAYSEAGSADSDTARSWDDVANKAHNDFETVVFERQPALSSIRDALRTSGAKIAMLSGSGSALFGIYTDVSARDRAAEHLEARLNGAAILRAATLA